MDAFYCHSVPSMTASLLPLFLYPPITPHVTPTREINHYLDQSHALAAKYELAQALKLFLKAEEMWNTCGGMSKANKTYLLLYKGFLHSLLYHAQEDKTNRSLINYAVVCYMEAIDLAESIVPHTADTALPRMYLAMDLYYVRCYEQATVLLKQAEAILRSSEGPRSLLVYMCSYNILACYVAMLQYSNEYRSGLVSTIAADQLHGDKAPFPIDHQDIAKLESLGVQTFQGLRQQYQYLDESIADQKLMEPPERKELIDLLAMGLGQQGTMFRKDVLEKIKNNPHIYDGCNSLIMFDFLQSSEFLQIGSLGVCQPETLVGKDVAESKASSPGTTVSAMIATTVGKDARISSLAKDLIDHQLCRDQERYMVGYSPQQYIQEQQQMPSDIPRFNRDSESFTSSPVSSASLYHPPLNSTGITPPATRPPGNNAGIDAPGASCTEDVHYKIGFPIDSRAYTLDEDGLYAAVSELGTIEEAMTIMVGNTHYYTNAVKRLKRICVELQEMTQLKNDKHVMDAGVEAFKHKFRYLSKVNIQPKMLGSGGKPKGKKGKKGK